MSELISSVLAELKALDERYEGELAQKAARYPVHDLIRRARRFLSTGEADGSLLDDLESFYRRKGGQDVPAGWCEAIEAKRTAAPKKKNGGGRPPKYDWLDISFELMRRANDPDGLRTREQIRQIVNEYIVSWPEQPEDSQVRDFVGRVCDELHIRR
jgi:hypothetical protein